jgi:hypothetical protein
LRLKKIALSMLLMLSLCACQKQDGAMQKALDFRNKLLAAGGCAFTAEIAADYGGTVEKFTGSCRYQTDQSAEITLTAPDSIAGVTASVTKDGAKVTFGDTSVAFGSLANGNLAPMAAPCILGDCFACEYIDSAGTENGLCHVVYLKGYNDQELRADVWFSEEQTPVQCEISYNGQKALTAVLSDFTYG